MLWENNLTYNNGEHGCYTSDSSDYGILRGTTMHHNVGVGQHMNGGIDSGGDGIMSYWTIEKNTAYQQHERLRRRRRRAVHLEEQPRLRQQRQAAPLHRRRRRVQRRHQLPQRPHHQQHLRRPRDRLVSRWRCVPQTYTHRRAHRLQDLQQHHLQRRGPVHARHHVHELAHVQATSSPTTTSS